MNSSPRARNTNVCTRLCESILPFMHMHRRLGSIIKAITPRHGPPQKIVYSFNFSQFCWQSRRQPRGTGYMYVLHRGGWLGVQKICMPHKTIACQASLGGQRCLRGSMEKEKQKEKGFRAAIWLGQKLVKKIWLPSWVAGRPSHSKCLFLPAFSIHPMIPSCSIICI